MFDKLQQLLTFCDKDGKAITFFDGKITLSQLIAIFVTISIVLIVLKIFKGVVKAAFTVGIICFFLVYMGVASPTQIKDAASVIASKGLDAYTKVVEASENIKFSGNSISLRIEDSWFDISEVSSLVMIDDGVATVIINEETYIVDDPTIISLLKTFK